MDIAAFLKALEASGLATKIRDSLWLFPLIESTHVFGLTLVFGTIAIIDLRLLGLASTQRPFQRMASDILKWTWGAFALTALTGSLMFITNAGRVLSQFLFRTKMLLLVLTGINMLVFEVTAGRTIHRWDKAPSAPGAGKAVAVLSLTMWIGIIFMGRLIGFTTHPGRCCHRHPASISTTFFNRRRAITLVEVQRRPQGIQLRNDPTRRVGALGARLIAFLSHHYYPGATTRMPSPATGTKTCLLHAFAATVWLPRRM